MFDESPEFGRVHKTISDSTSDVDIADAPTTGKQIVIRRVVIGPSNNLHTAGMKWGITNGAGTYYLGPFTMNFPNDIFAKDLFLRIPIDTKATLTKTATGTGAAYSGHFEYEIR